MSSTLEELQVKVAFLEDTMAKISEEFYLQQKQLLELKQRHAALVDKLRNTQTTDSEATGAEHETPPHY